VSSAGAGTGCVISYKGVHAVLGPLCSPMETNTLTSWIGSSVPLAEVAVADQSTKYSPSDHQNRRNSHTLTGLSQPLPFSWPATTSSRSAGLALSACCAAEGGAGKSARSAKQGISHVPDVMRPVGDDRLWNSDWTLPRLSSRHDRGHVSVFHLQRHAPGIRKRLRVDLSLRASPLCVVDGYQLCFRRRAK
jgi:hypothetical protein